jgi:hypothetical protein
MDDFEMDIKLMRLLDHALALACRVVQDLATRHLVILPSVGGSVRFAHAATARSWLREYAYCGRHARRCFLDEKHVCRSLNRSC